MTTPVNTAYETYGTRYIVVRDEVNGTWRICDLLHPDLNGFNYDDDIPDNHPAITLLLDGQFTALFQEAIKLGFDMERFARMGEVNSIIEHENRSIINMDFSDDERGREQEGLVIQPILEQKESLPIPITMPIMDDKNTYGLSMKKLQLLEKMISTHDYSPEDLERITGMLMRIGGNGDV